MFGIKVTHNYDFSTKYDFISTDNIIARQVTGRSFDLELE